MRELIELMEKSRAESLERQRVYLTDFMLDLASHQDENNNPLDILIAVEEEHQYTEWDFD
tara:strand:+ start:1069 stop:1248 length:180 start_codon:yes stop_codon:yes gene_type:complete